MDFLLQDVEYLFEDSTDSDIKESINTFNTWMRYWSNYLDEVLANETSNQPQETVKS